MDGWWLSSCTLWMVFTTTKNCAAKCTSHRTTNSYGKQFFFDSLLVKCFMCDRKLLLSRLADPEWMNEQKEKN